MSVHDHVEDVTSTTGITDSTGHTNDTKSTEGAVNNADASIGRGGKVEEDDVGNPNPNVNATLYNTTDIGYQVAVLDAHDAPLPQGVQEIIGESEDMNQYEPSIRHIDAQVVSRNGDRIVLKLPVVSEDGYTMWYIPEDFEGEDVNVVMTDCVFEEGYCIL
jgi:hypothetical protein